MPVSRGPYVLLHELLELRIVFQFRHGLPVDPELSRRGEDSQLLEPLQGLRDVFHPNLEVVEGLAGNVRGPERAPFGVPVQFHPLARAAVSEQDVLAFLTPSPHHLLQADHLWLKPDRPPTDRGPNAAARD